MSVEALKDYGNWAGNSSWNILQNVKRSGGWARIFPREVPDWANSVRNFFNVTPRRLKFLGPYNGMQRAPDVQKVGWSEGIGTAMALSGDVYIDEQGRYWYEMDTGGTGYHYKGGRTSDGGAVVSHFTPQAFIPVFKLISPDGTGGSREVCIHNWRRGVTRSGHKRIAGLNEWADVSTKVVLDKHYQGSYNYSETVVMGLTQHELRDVKPHKIMKRRYVDPPRWLPLAARFFPRE